MNKTSNILIHTLTTERAVIEFVDDENQALVDDMLHYALATVAEYGELAMAKSMFPEGCLQLLYPETQDQCLKRMEEMNDMLLDLQLCPVYGPIYYMLVLPHTCTTHFQSLMLCAEEDGFVKASPRRAGLSLSIYDQPTNY